jgi:ribonuclease G
MSVNIYVDSNGGNVIGAVADGEKLIEYRVEKKNKTVTIGSIFKGRVENILPGMQAAFVNVGLSRNGYLSATDMLMDKSELVGKVEIPSILNLSEGDEIMVQAVKDPAGTKGVRLTSNISFAARYVVFMPTIDFVGVSRRIVDEKTREKLTALAESIKPEGQGVIIRTAAEGVSKGEIKRELVALVKQYKDIEEKFKTAPVSTCVFEEGNIAIRLIRDVYSSKIDKFIVGDKETYETVLEYSKRTDVELKKKLRLYDKKVDMFRYYGLEKEVSTLLSNTVPIANGGYIVIDKTEALTSIDVNTGRYTGVNENLEDTVFNTNLAAAEEIARQLRLRNLSGMIVVDFIDMEIEEHKQKLLEVLGRFLEKDREKCTLVGMTPLGLVEITRKKRRRESASMLVKACPYCQGSGVVQSNDYIVMRIRTGLLDLFADGYNTAIVDLNIEIADYIFAKKILKKDVEKIWKEKRIYIIPHKTYHQQFFLIKGDNGKVVEVPDSAILLY